MKTYARQFCIADAAFCIALGLSATAALGCGSSSSCLEPPCGSGGAGGTAGTGGSTGTAGNGASGGTAGAAGNSGTGGSAGSGGGAGGGGGAGTAGSAGNGPDSGGPICGGIAGLTCPETMYCDYPGDACGGPDGTGVCMPRPGLCSRDCPGACGCDGKFYCNVCEAQRAGFDGTQGACPDAASLRTRR